LYCKNKAYFLCSTCRCRKTRIEDPERYNYNNIKNRAKQRGIDFTITLDQFRKFCYKVNYSGYAAGKATDSRSIDRIDNTKGYIEGNLAVVSIGYNVQKFFMYDYKTKEYSFFDVNKNTNQTDNDNPF
jgi:hypothetical protein